MATQLEELLGHVVNNDQIEAQAMKHQQTPPVSHIKPDHPSVSARAMPSRVLPMRAFVLLFKSPLSRATVMQEEGPGTPCGFGQVSELSETVSPSLK